MLHLSKEKLVVSLQRLILYLSLIENGKVARKHDVKKLHAYAKDFLSDLVDDQLDLQESVEQYQDLVTRVNAVSTNATYPKIQTHSVANLLRSDVIAFENCLQQYMLVGNLTVLDEAKLFEKAMQLWMGSNLDTIAEVVKGFKQLVDLTNIKLPKELQYPLPSIEEYPLEEKPAQSQQKP